MLQRTPSTPLACSLLQQMIGFTKKIHPYQYLPFHAGPRLCLGMNMAFLEAKLVACVILQKFRYLFLLCCYAFLLFI